MADPARDTIAGAVSVLVDPAQAADVKSVASAEVPVQAAECQGVVRTPAVSIRPYGFPVDTVALGPSRSRPAASVCDDARLGRPRVPYGIQEAVPGLLELL
ncbi:hypothetical protein GCM10009540_50350 [Streptomyces turgidiscabies]|nr:hypothetical protein T45_05953 [Streptomyces turgidiscabies]